MLKIKEKRYGLKMMANEIRQNKKGDIIAVHIPIIGWKDAKEFEIKGEPKE